MITYEIHDWWQRGPRNDRVTVVVDAREPGGQTTRATLDLLAGDDHLEPPHQDVERWVPAHLLDFFTAYSEDSACEVEYGLLDAVRAEIHVDELDLDRICGACNGSGEGMYDGTSCWSCRGSGVGK